MRLLPEVVEDYLHNAENSSADPRQIFSITTNKYVNWQACENARSGGIEAALTFRRGSQTCVVIEGLQADSRYEALVNLLSTTEILLSKAQYDARDKQT